jgi:hypothetical protein
VCDEDVERLAVGRIADVDTGQGRDDRHSGIEHISAPLARYMTDLGRRQRSTRATENRDDAVARRPQPPQTDDDGGTP